MRKTLTLCIIGLLLPVLLATPALAEPEANKAEIWTVTVKNGHGPAFEEAFKAHIAMRAEKEDPRNWQVYNAVTGDGLNNYYIRYCCVSWADMDSYRDWSQGSGLGEHWNEHVDPHVEAYEHDFSAVDFENSNWPEDAGAPVYVGVTTWTLHEGKGAAFSASKKQLSDAAKAGDWPRYWSWLSAISGGNKVYLASPFADYASMEPPEKSFAELLTEQMGSEEAAMEALQNFSANFKKSYYTIYVRRPDLSMGGDSEE